MSAADAEKLEAKLQTQPDDLEARSQLLLYYQFSTDQDCGAHYFWIVEHHPDAPVLDGWGRFRLMHSSRQREAKALWLRQVEAHSNNARVLANAARALDFVEDGKLAIRLLEQAAVVDPGNPEWPRRVGHQFELMARDGERVHKDLAQRSLTAYERALTLSSKADRFYLLGDAAVMSLACDELDKAKTLAVELLDCAAEMPADWNFGNAIHHGNLILGFVAMRGERIDEAEEYLVRAGKTPGSPQLNSFGPNMGLALELLKKGRKDAVLQYFALCRKFWKTPELDAWTKTVEEGGIPDFGANLDY